MHPSRLRFALPWLVLCLSVLLVAGTWTREPATARPAPIGQDPIVPGAVYAGDFPDPWIIRVGARYLAYSTTSDGVNLPLLASTNLRTWVARAQTADAPRGDGLPTLPAWAGATGPWAPSVTRLGKHHFVLAYAVQVAASPGQRMCISLAHATTPIGPFVDHSAGPAVCPDRGAIDPQVFLTPKGHPWLVWKIDHYPARLYTQPMNDSATRVRPGFAPRFLAKIRQAWEGHIIENPAMIRFHKRYYLFYSANSYATTRYAIGYLICKSWKGDCRRPRKKPLLATGGTIAGPGGPAPFVDRHGRFRLGYHAWTVGTVGYPTSDACRTSPGGCGQRRLYVATLRVDDRGRLHVAARY